MDLVQPELLVMGDGPGAAEIALAATDCGVEATSVTPRDVAGGGPAAGGWPWPFPAVAAPAPAPAPARAFLAGQGAVFVDGPGGPAPVRSSRIVLAPRLRPARPSWWEGPAVVEAPPRDAPVARVLVIGGGHTGVEVAAAWASVGSEVLLIEAADRLLPAWDADLAAAGRAALEARGVVVLAGLRAVACADTRDGVQVSLRAGSGLPDRVETAAVVVPALGWRPALAGYGLERTRALADRHGFLEADSRGETAERGLHAIGGALSLPLTQAGVSRQASIIARLVAGQLPPPLRHAQVPRLVSGPVPLLAAGLSPVAAGARGHRSGCGRAESGDGTWVRCVTDLETGALLGVQAAGPGAAALAPAVENLLCGEAGAPSAPGDGMPPLLAEAWTRGGSEAASRG